MVAQQPLVASMAARLRGHRFREGDHVLVLERVADRGRPWVGVVSARCDRLWLDTAMGSLVLTGPLARPRIAGPGYLVWALGRRRGNELMVWRAGVLARPDELAAGWPVADIDHLPCSAAPPQAPSPTAARR